MGSIKFFAIDIDGTLTENGGGAVFLPALETLRCLESLGFKIIYVTGRSALEAYLLAVFGGTTRLSVGENGGDIMMSPQQHILLATKQECLCGYELLKRNIKGVKIKPLIDRYTEVVLFRTFDLEKGQKVLQDYNMNLYLSDSKYAYHINRIGVDKGKGLNEALKILRGKLGQTVAIGDSETDIPMFKICEYSVALGHAEDQVKRSAQHVVKGREGRGLVDAIDFISFNYLGLRNDVSSRIRRNS